MKKTVILSTQNLVNIKQNMSAFVRIAWFLERNVENVTILSRDFEKYREEVDNIIIAYGTFYADFKGMMTFLERNKDKRFFFLVNEVRLMPNGSIYKFLIEHNYDVICNFQEESSGPNHYVDYHMVNLNLTAFRDIETLSFENRGKRLIYWGTYRPNRAKYFKKYFKDISLSTSDKAKKDFLKLFHREAIKDVNIVDKINFDEHSLLNHYKFSLYIEDEYTHTHYNHLADRFHEAVSMGLVTFFDRNTENNVKLSGYPIDEFYFIDSREELEEKMTEVEKNPDKYLKDLQIFKQLVIEEKKILTNRLTEILNSDRDLKKYDKCSSCGSIAYKKFICESCKKELCSSCLKMYIKQYCEECYMKLENKGKETTEVALF